MQSAKLALAGLLMLVAAANSTVAADPLVTGLWQKIDEPTSKSVGWFLFTESEGIYQGRIAKGILYSVSILSLFLVGLAMGNWKIIYWRWVNPMANTEAFCFNYLGQFWAGLVALPALIQATLPRDHAEFLWNFMAEPSQREINGLYPALGKFVEIGTLYTTVAGLLNILAMVDTFEIAVRRKD